MVYTHTPSTPAAPPTQVTQHFRPSVIGVTVVGPNIEIKETEKGCYVLPDLDERKGRLTLTLKYDRLIVDLRSPFVLVAGSQCSKVDGRDIVPNLVLRKSFSKSATIIKVKDLCRLHLARTQSSKCRLVLIKSFYDTFTEINEPPPEKTELVLSWLGSLCQDFSMCAMAKGSGNVKKFNGVIKLLNVVESAPLLTVIWDVFPTSPSSSSLSGITVSLQGHILTPSRNHALASLQFSNNPKSSPRFPPSSSISLATHMTRDKDGAGTGKNHWVAGNYVQITILIYEGDKAIGYGYIMNEILKDEKSVANVRSQLLLDPATPPFANAEPVLPLQKLSQLILSLPPQSPAQPQPPVIPSPSTTSTKLANPTPPPPTTTTLTLSLGENKLATTTITVTPSLTTIIRTDQSTPTTLVAVLLPIPTIVTVNHVPTIQTHTITQPLSTPTTGADVGGVGGHAWGRTGEGGNLSFGAGHGNSPSSPSSSSFPSDSIVNGVGGEVEKSVDEGGVYTRSKVAPVVGGFVEVPGGEAVGDAGVGKRIVVSALWAGILGVVVGGLMVV